MYSTKGTLLKKEIEAILNNAYDLVTVVDGTGHAISASSSLEKYFGIPVSEYIGTHVRFLEDSNILSKSIAAEILRTKRPQRLIQDTKNGHRLAVKGVPIFDDHGSLVRIYNFSKDITEVSYLKNELKETEELLQIYRTELHNINITDVKEKALIVRSSKMENLFELAKKMASVDSTILITGESGVGKEVIATFIHDSSKYSQGAFVKINCGAIPENLLEAELFGYEKGAFTGALKEGRQGRVALANNGTLFLDEIGDMPLLLQVKILQLVQDKIYYPIGSSRPVKTNSRIITATHRNLVEMVSSGSFRQDLYYRLNVLPIHLPPLRERKEEIPLLTVHFLKYYEKKYGIKKRFSPKAIEAFTKYSWPGNVRQLENMIERLVVTIEGEVIDLVHLPQEIISAFQAHQSDVALKIEDTDLATAVENLEKRILANAYRRYGQTNKVAKALGIHRSTVVRKVNRYFGKDSALKVN
jgi:transcriptional regulator with PAS, ATPase and Fis domain